MICLRWTFTILQSRYKTSLPSLSTSCFSCEPSDTASTVPRRGKHAPFRRETSRECHKVCIPFPSSPLPGSPASNAASLGAPPTPHSCPLCKAASPNPTAAARGKRSSSPYLQPKTSVQAATTPSRLFLKRSPSLLPLGRCPARSLPRRPGAHGRAPLAARATSLSLWPDHDLDVACSPPPKHRTDESVNCFPSVTYLLASSRFFIFLRCSCLLNLFCRNLYCKLRRLLKGIVNHLRKDNPVSIPYF
jgi:hypothetical protein